VESRAKELDELEARFNTINDQWRKGPDQVEALSSSEELHLKEIADLKLRHSEQKAALEKELADSRNREATPKVVEREVYVETGYSRRQAGLVALAAGLAGLGVGLVVAALLP